jgi:TolA-binding protein
MLRVCGTLRVEAMPNSIHFLPSCGGANRHGFGSHPLFPATFLVESGLVNAEASIMRMKLLGFVVAVALACPLAAQTAASPISPRPTTPTRQARQSPCWQQAGISQSAIEQRKQIEESTHGQVESVCNDSSLTPQQKQQKIHQLHQEAQQQMQGLITPQQEQALKSCREKRGEGPHMGGMHRGGGGPCAEMTPANKP